MPAASPPTGRNPHNKPITRIKLSSLQNPQTGFT